MMLFYGGVVRLLADNIRQISLAEIAQRHLPYCVVDLEVTLDERIWEICAISYDYDRAEIDKFHEFIDPGLGVPTSCHQDGSRNSRPPEQVLEEFYTFIDGRAIITHNALFDIAMLRKHESCLPLGSGTPKVNQYACSLVAAQFLGLGLHRHDLKTLASRFKIELSEHHRADHDAKATGEIVRILLSKLDNGQVEINDEIYFYSLHRELTNLLNSLRYEMRSIQIKEIARECSSKYKVQEDALRRAHIKYRKYLHDSGLLNSFR